MIPALFSLEGKFPSGLNVSELETEVGKVMEEFIDKSTYGATIAVSKGTELIWSASYGHSDKENNVEMLVNDSLEWGSITKLLTFTSVMQLVEKGKLELDRDIRDYVGKDFFRKLKYDDKITILNLMHHSAGWEEMRKVTQLQNPKSEVDLGTFLRTVEPFQRWRPGEHQAYSNYASGVAGYIVEKVTGQKLYDYVRENIFKKLGMTHCSMKVTRDDITEPVHEVEDYLSSLENIDNSRFGVYPAGSAIGPVEELAMFGRELTPIDGHQTKLFESNSTLEMFLSHSYGPVGYGNSHGIWEMEWDEIGYEHQGNTLGQTARLIFLPESDYSLAILCNSYGESHIMSRIPRLLFGQPDRASDISSFPSVSKYAGWYQGLRAIFSGIAGYFRIFMVATIEAEGEHKLKVGSLVYEQITEDILYAFDQDTTAPYLFLKGDGVINIGFQDYIQTTYGAIAGEFLAMSAGGLAASALCLIFFVITYIRYLCKRKEIPLKERVEPFHIMSGVLSFLMMIFCVYCDVSFLEFINTMEYEYNQQVILALFIFIWFTIGAEIGYLIYFLVKKFTKKNDPAKTDATATLNDMEENSDNENMDQPKQQIKKFPWNHWVTIIVSNVYVWVVIGCAYSINLFEY